jgi:hypothetical protein
VLAAIAAATPYLFFERRDLWDRSPAASSRGTAGRSRRARWPAALATLWRRGARPRARGAAARAAGDGAAPPAAPRSTTGAAGSRCRDHRPIDGAERDPLDLELGLENLVRLAAQYDDEEADARAARFATRSRRPSRGAPHRARPGPLGSARRRSTPSRAARGPSRCALGPLLATGPAGSPVRARPRETWDIARAAPAELLDTSRSGGAGAGADLETDLTLEVLAIRLGGYALDACGEDRTSVRGAARRRTTRASGCARSTASRTARASSPGPERALFAVLALRRHHARHGPGRGRRREWLGPFAAWWALVIDRPRC